MEYNFILQCNYALFLCHFLLTMIAVPAYPMGYVFLELV